MHTLPQCAIMHVVAMQRIIVPVIRLALACCRLSETVTHWNGWTTLLAIEWTSEDNQAWNMVRIVAAFARNSHQGTGHSLVPK